MNPFPEEMKICVRITGEPIKDFVTGEDTYYGVTGSGFLFNIIRCYSAQPPIVDHEDYHTYLLVHAVEGIFILRQRFLKGSAGKWHLKAAVESLENSPVNFEDVREYLEQNPKIYETICQNAGYPEDEETDEISRDPFIYPRAPIKSDR